jgi:hypothetical protein
VTPLAYVLIVVVPLTAFVTVGIALIPGRPGPGRSMDTAALTTRIAAIDAELDAGGSTARGSQLRQLKRERRRLHDELLRRGHGHFTPS